MTPDQSFYTPADVDCTNARVDRVYSTRYQREKNACIERLLAHVSLDRAHVLEIGCGAGVWTRRLLESGASVVAVDIRDHPLDAARRRVPAKLAARCDFRKGELDQAVPADERFSLVILKDVIEHVQDDALLLAQIHARLSSGGALLVSTQNALSLNAIWEGFWERIIKRRRQWRGWDSTHVRFYTPGSLRKLLTSTGFRITHQNAAYFFPYRWFGTRLGKPSWEPGWLHALDRHSDDNWLANWGWSIHRLAVVVP